MLNARLKGAALLPSIGVLCALPLASASAHSRHDGARRDCGLHQVVVRGEVSAAPASGSSSFTATVWSVRVSEIRLSDHSRYADDPVIAAACATANGTTTSSTTTSSTTTTSGGTTCPAGTTKAAARDESSNQVVKGIAINTGSATKVMLDGASSAVGSLAKEDHFVAVFIVPACAGNGSNSGIPATLLAAWTPHSSGNAVSHDGAGRERHHHRGDHGHRGDQKLKK